jgi:Protein of unknown function (DUF2934)
MPTHDKSDKSVPREQIELRAYEIFLQRGGSDGNELEDWLRAERELLGDQASAASETPDANTGVRPIRPRAKRAAAGDSSSD